MVNQTILNPIKGYIREIDNLLPYPDEIKSPVLNELRKDVLDAVGADKRPPSVIFGSPREVAKNLSLAHDWGTKRASWVLRILAFIIDAFVLFSTLIILVILPLLFVVQEEDMKAWISVYFPIGIFIGIPATIFVFCYFLFFEKTYSTTLGKRVLGLIVVDESGTKLTWTQTLIRNLSKLPLPNTFLPLDVIVGIVSDKTRNKKQRALDFVAGTIVVRRT